MGILAALLPTLTVPGAWMASRIYLRRNVPRSSLQKRSRAFGALEVCVCAISFAFFLFFNWFLYEGLAQQRIYSLARSAHGAFFHQESSPFLYWLTVAVAYLAAVMAGSTLFVCATLWRANRKRSP